MRGSPATARHGAPWPVPHGTKGREGERVPGGYSSPALCPTNTSRKLAPLADVDDADVLATCRDTTREEEESDPTSYECERELRARTRRLR